MSDRDAISRKGLCRVLVHCASNVPSVDRFRGLPDPYVDVHHLGSLID